MTAEELQEKIEEHERWFKGEIGAKRLDLSHAKLFAVDLRGANLSMAILRETNFSWADLSWANLAGADLTGADLTGTDLKYANLKAADLSSAILWNTCLTNADLNCVLLSDADLYRVSLEGTNLASAQMRGANLEYVKPNEDTAFYHLQCPEEGSFIGFKKCKNDLIVKLLIPEDAKRSSATSRKCRCSKATVLSITDCEGKKKKKAVSEYDDEFVYRVGETLEVPDFDENRWNECGSGIHFFITRQEAVDYEF